MSEDLIRNEGPNIKAQLVISLIQDAAGMPTGVVVASSGEFNEIYARYMLDHARAKLDDHWRMANAPRIVPTNGQSLSLLDKFKRPNRG